MVRRLHHLGERMAPSTVRPLIRPRYIGQFARKVPMLSVSAGAAGQTR
jgi:hypothetical protein